MRRRGVNFEVEGGEVQREDVFIPPLETEKKKLLDLDCASEQTPPQRPFSSFRGHLIQLGSFEKHYISSPR